jgi:hypothetical protein
LSKSIDKKLSAVARSYDVLASSLPEPLRGQARALAKALAPEHSSLVEYYGAQESYPLLRFPLWLEEKYVDEKLISPREGFGVKVATATLFGYLYIRIQDNVLDEPDLFDSAYLLVGNELIREFFTIYHTLFPAETRFWDYLREYWRATTNNTLWEWLACNGRLQDFDLGDLAKVAGKLDGSKVSIAAVCMKAGREKDISRYADVMDDLNVASQLHNDVVSFVKDLKHRYFTSVISKTVKGEEPVHHDEIFHFANLRALTGSNLEDSLSMSMHHNNMALGRVDKDELSGLDGYVHHKNLHLEAVKRDLSELKKEILSIGG